MASWGHARIPRSVAPRALLVSLPSPISQWSKQMSSQSVRPFELFHGAALTKLVRSDRQVTLRMIETNTAIGWAAYKINDSLILYVKYSTNPRELKHGSVKWHFTLNPGELIKIRDLRNRDQVFMALICG